MYFEVGGGASRGGLLDDRVRRRAPSIGHTAGKRCARGAVGNSIDRVDIRPGMPPTRTPQLAPYLVVKDAAGLARFIERALGGKISYEERDATGAYRHAEARIADSVVMFADVPEGRSPFPAMLHLYVPDVGAIYAKALAEGAKVVRVPTLQPDGDRRGGVRDRWGNEWWFTALAKGT
jgi:PhnB protein